MESLNVLKIRGYREYYYPSGKLYKKEYVSIAECCWCHDIKECIIDPSVAQDNAIVNNIINIKCQECHKVSRYLIVHD